MASPIAFHVGHLLNRDVRSAFVQVGGVIPGVHQDLGPGDERKCAEHLGLDLNGDIEILNPQYISRRRKRECRT